MVQKLDQGAAPPLGRPSAPAPPRVVAPASLRTLWTLQLARIAVFSALTAGGIWLGHLGQWSSALMMAAVAVWVCTDIAKVWSAIDAHEAARWLARAGVEAAKKDDAGNRAAFLLARRAWRAAPRGGRTHADGLAQLAYLLNADGRGRDALRLLRAVPASFRPPPVTRAEAHLLCGDSQEALNLVDPLKQELDQHAAHVHARALLQMGRLEDAIAWLQERSGGALCLEAFHELQHQLLVHHRLDESILAGELGIAKQEHALGAWLLSEAHREASRHEEAARWLARAESLGFREGMATGLKEVLAKYVLAPSPDQRGTVLPAQLDLDGPETESLNELLARWAGVTVVGQVVAALLVGVPVAMVGGDAAPAAVVVLGGALRGALLGVGQWWILRRSTDDARWWPVLTALGGAFGTAAALWVANDDAVQSPLFLATGAVFLFECLPLLFATCFQVLLLTRWFERTWVWAVVAAASVGLAEVVIHFVWRAFDRVAPLSGVGQVAAHHLFVGVVSGLLVGLACGAVLGRWLVQRRAERLLPRQPQR